MESISSWPSTRSCASSARPARASRRFSAASTCSSRSTRVASSLRGDEITAARVDVDRVRSGIGIVFQAFNLFPHMSVLENVTLGPRKALRLGKAEAAARATELLGRFGLADKRDEYPDRLSGGQQQRVAIVRALAMQPELAPARRGHERARSRARGRGARGRARARSRGDDDADRHARDELRPRCRPPGLLPRRGRDPGARKRRSRSSERRASLVRSSSCSGSSTPGRL